ncbi:hypothetical protein BaRGS_00038243 [Batillaria attramentaria]|uniref:Uncharacterized protein n=1 Tax=Batillaria attramentaria TaxID=370345 RepID=A0ABD0J6F2_9CAEN
MCLSHRDRRLLHPVGQLVCSPQPITCPQCKVDRSADLAGPAARIPGRSIWSGDINVRHIEYQFIDAGRGAQQVQH